MWRCFRPVARGTSHTTLPSRLVSTVARPVKPGSHNLRVAYTAMGALVGLVAGIGVVGFSSWNGEDAQPRSARRFPSQDSHSRFYANEATTMKVT